MFFVHFIKFITGFVKEQHHFGVHHTLQFSSSFMLHVFSVKPVLLAFRDIFSCVNVNFQNSYKLVPIANF